MDYGSGPSTQQGGSDDNLNSPSAIGDDATAGTSQVGRQWWLWLYAIRDRSDIQLAISVVASPRVIKVASRDQPHSRLDCEYHPLVPGYHACNMVHCTEVGDWMDHAHVAHVVIMLSWDACIRTWSTSLL